MRVRACVSASTCVCEGVCVRERERERERKRVREKMSFWREEEIAQRPNEGDTFLLIFFSTVFIF